MIPPLSWFYLLAVVGGLAIGGLVLLARPARLQNRLLALLVFFEVVAHAGAVLLGVVESGSGPPDLGLLHASEGLLWYGAFTNALAYLAFLGTVDTRWSRPLASRRARVGLGVVVALGWTLRLVAPSWTHAYVEAGVHMIGAADPWIWFLTGAVSLFGLVVAVSYWRGATPGTLRRRQAGVYTAAFGARDTVFVIFGLLALGRLLGLHDLVLLGEPLGSWAPPLATVLFAPLAAYGILTTQLFDIDLKIKWTLEKSTVAAIFVAVFFAVSEGAQILFAEFAGSELLGVAAAALLVFVLAPLQRLGERVSDAAMPGVEDTEEYREQRKREVYRASLEELLADEEITAKERRMLGRLQEELGLEGGEASRIEADMVEGGGDAA